MGRRLAAGKEVTAMGRRLAAGKLIRRTLRPIVAAAAGVALVLSVGVTPAEAQAPDRPLRVIEPPCTPPYRHPGGGPSRGRPRRGGAP